MQLRLEGLDAPELHNAVGGVDPHAEIVSMRQVSAVALGVRG